MTSKQEMTSQTRQWTKNLVHPIDNRDRPHCPNHEQGFLAWSQFLCHCHLGLPGKVVSSRVIHFKDGVDLLVVRLCVIIICRQTLKTLADAGPLGESR